LPKKGTCKHYGKSYRWFRFPCCGKLYPCDTCHDAQETGHPAQMARRVMCGLCSEEQPYRGDVEICRSCGGTFAKGSDGRPYWEGGKGMRDKSKMSRKDAHKYRGLNKTVAKKG
ncbi:CHY zinc finger-domain-containing protein, partial [Dimargaris cristalligena]